MFVLRNRPWWFSYLLAIAVTLATIGLRRWLDVLGEGVEPFTLFYPAVLICALFGGAGPGLLSLAISCLAVTLWWLDPVGTFALSDFGAINLVLFVVTSGIIILTAHFLRSAHFRLHENEARLTLSQQIGRIGIWDLDLKTGSLWWSSTFRTLTGLGPDQAPTIEAVLDRIDPRDKDRTYAAFDAARQGRDKLDTEFRLVKDDGETVWLASRAELFRDAAGRPSRLLGINFDATPMRKIEGERDRANTLLQTFFETLPGAAYVKDAEGRVLLANPFYAASIGQNVESLRGKSDIEFLQSEEQARIFMARDRAVLESGLPQQVEEDLVHPDGATSHWLSVKSPFRDAQGQVQGIVGISLDVTERRKADKRLRFLADEVDHRAKNLLGVVQSIVRLTKADDIAAFKTALTGRIQALARTHNLLATSRWDGVDIATLVKEELAPFEAAKGARIRISGPSVHLEPNASQALTMVLHELAINAASYGALSLEEGELTVKWQLTDRHGRNSVELSWTEARGPEVATLVEPGFGAFAIRGAVEHQLAGTLDIDWHAQGVTCRIVFPVNKDVVQLRPSAAVQQGATSSGPGGDLRGLRVLILDDEALMAATLGDFVEDLGCEIAGSVPSARAAISLLREHAPDIAILDINLAGESSAPVANALQALGVPFVYCTGYARPAEQIERRVQAETLIKPIDQQELASALKRAVEATPSLHA